MVLTSFWCNAYETTSRRRTHFRSKSFDQMNSFYTHTTHVQHLYEWKSIQVCMPKLYRKMHKVLGIPWNVRTKQLMYLLVCVDDSTVARLAFIFGLEVVLGAHVVRRRTLIFSGITCFGISIPTIFNAFVTDLVTRN